MGALDTVAAGEYSVGGGADELANATAIAPAATPSCAAMPARRPSRSSACVGHVKECLTYVDIAESLHCASRE